MKDGILDTVGKTISGVVVKHRDKQPWYQVFFVFTDNSYFELYGDDIQGISYLRDGDKQAVREYMPSGKIVFERHLED